MLMLMSRSGRCLLPVLLSLLVTSGGGARAAGTQVAKLTAADAAADDQLGNSISISGDTVVVGAYGDASDSGSAYVFERNLGGLDNWGQVAKLTAMDAAAGDLFGHSVSISGDTVVVGAPGDDDAASASGSVYVFERNLGGLDNWGQVAKLTAADAAMSDQFGYSVSISGDTVVVGTFGDDDAGSESGSVYVFERNVGGLDNWGQVAKLNAADAASGDQFGISVSISGNTVIVGALFGNSASGNSGSVYAFERNLGGPDNWGQVAKRTAADAAAGDRFGGSVSISGDTVVVGAYRDDDAGSDSGSAYVFERNVGGLDNWGQVEKLTAADAAVFDFFGISVSISGDTVVVGAFLDDDAGSTSGSVYVFVRNVGGLDNWGQVQKLTAADAASGDQFGNSVSISGDTVVVGAYLDDDVDSDSGSAYVYDFDGPTCGDGLQESPEECDDGNLIDGDGCDTNCLVEPGANVTLVTIGSGYELLDGVPLSMPYTYGVQVVGTGIQAVEVVTPNGRTLQLVDDGDSFNVDRARENFEALRNDPELGFGSFVVRIQDTKDVWDAVFLDYDPGTSPPVTGYYQPITPSHGQVDVPLAPTFQWSCSNSDCGTFDWEMKLGLLGDDDTAFYASLSTTETSWVPGPLSPGLWYWLEPDSREYVGAGPQSPSTLGGDSFSYQPIFFTRNRLEFATAGSPQPSTLTMGSNRDQVDGVDACFTHEILVTGTGLSPLTVTPPGGSPIDIPPAGIGSWAFESGCFASEAALEAAFPRDEIGTYDVAFGGMSDSDSLSFSNVAFPECLPVITAPSHDANTTATPTIEWSVDCALAPSHCHYALEVASDGEPVIEQFDTDCPGNNSLPIPPDTLTPGVTYRFWVELTAGDNGAPATTAGLEDYTYSQGAQNSNEIVFTVGGGPDDMDGDAVMDATDNCPIVANPEQGPAPFPSTVLASGKALLEWEQPLPHVIVKGDFTGAEEIAGYPYSWTTTITEEDPSALLTTRPIPNSPGPGAGFWYLFKPHCIAGSWSSSGAGEQPGRDQVLP